MGDVNTDTSAARNRLAHLNLIAGLIVGTAFLLWILTPVVLSWIFPDKLSHRGLFGDMFGSINSLFSGLALAGVIYAILLQKEELALQRKEIRESREELRRSATAQEESRLALQKTIYANTFKVIHDILQQDKVVIARRNLILKTSKKDFSDWTENEREEARIIATTFDLAAIMSKYDMLPTQYFIETWGMTIPKIWKFIEPFVKNERADRCDDTWLVDFERVAVQATTGREKQLEEWLKKQGHMT